MPNPKLPNAVAMHRTCRNHLDFFSVSLSIRRSQNPLLPIKMEIATTIPAQALLDSGAVFQYVKQHNHRQNQDGEGEVRMIRSEVADLEEDILECTDRRLGIELRG